MDQTMDTQPHYQVSRSVVDGAWVVTDAEGVVDAYLNEPDAQSDADRMNAERMDDGADA